jgi:hypothetical protein
MDSRSDQARTERKRGRKDMRTLFEEEQNALGVEKDKIHGQRRAEKHDSNTLRPGPNSGWLV